MPSCLITPYYRPMDIIFLLSLNLDVRSDRILNKLFYGVHAWMVRTYVVVYRITYISAYCRPIAYFNPPSITSDVQSTSIPADVIMNSSIVTGHVVDDVISGVS